MATLDPNKMDFQRRTNFLSDPLDYRKKDVISTGLTYYGYAFPGVLTSEPYWLVKKVSVSGTVTTQEYSSVTKSFDVTWDNRTGVTYV